MKKKSGGKYLSNMNLASVFCEAIAHKLNNSLSGILGYLQFSLEKLNKASMDEGELEKIKKYLGLALDECKVGRNLMINLRSFNKEHVRLSKAGRKPSVELFKSLKECWKDLKEAGSFGGMEIEWQESDISSTVVAVTEEDLFCLLYTIIFSITILGKDNPPEKVIVRNPRKDNNFLETVFSFSVSAAKGENELKEAFLLAGTIVKSFFCKLEFSPAGSEIQVIVGFPLAEGCK
jgi:hypothetical protein